MNLVLEVLLIVALRMADVSLGTVRIMLLTRGSRWRASGVGFVETLIWVSAIAVVVRELDDPVRMIAYASGFALGTLLGVTIERKLAVGTVRVQAVAPSGVPSSADVLRDAGFRVTELDGEGRDGGVRVVTSVVPRRHVSNVVGTIGRVNPAAFVTVEDVTVSRSKRRAASLRK